MEIKEYIQAIIKIAEQEQESVHRQLKEKGEIVKGMCDNPEGAYLSSFSTWGGELAHLGGRAHELQVKLVQLNHILNNL